MGTRSRIAIRNDDGTYDSIYCHWDGYPASVGQKLLDHYQDPAKIRELIALGDISSLGAHIGEKHGFDSNVHRTNNWTKAYGRDRGRSHPAVRSADIDELNALTQETGGEWLYVWNGHGWTCAEGGVSAFGMPATAEPGGLEQIEYWIAKDAN